MSCRNHAAATAGAAREFVQSPRSRQAHRAGFASNASSGSAGTEAWGEPSRRGTCGATSPAVATQSDLAQLVAAEARLDRELDDARAEVAAARAVALQRVAAAAAELAVAIASARDQIARELTAATAAELQRIRDAGLAERADFDAVQGDRLAAIADALVARLVALASEEASS